MDEKFNDFGKLSYKDLTAGKILLIILFMIIITIIISYIFYYAYTKYNSYQTKNYETCEKYIIYSDSSTFIT